MIGRLTGKLGAMVMAWSIELSLHLPRRTKENQERPKSNQLIQDSDQITSVYMMPYYRSNPVHGRVLNNMLPHGSSASVICFSQSLIIWVIKEYRYWWIHQTTCCVIMGFRLSWWCVANNFHLWMMTPCYGELAWCFGELWLFLSVRQSD